MISKNNINSLQTTLAKYQQQVIIPHCHSCSRPCCMLTDVVLEFEWPHLQQLYQIKQDKKTFDRSLRDGNGPDYIRKQDGLYFTHGSPCPGYDQKKRGCRIYNTPLKPQNCSDFPLYMDNGKILADERCEALRADHLIALLQKNMPYLQLKPRPDPDFPYLVFISIYSKNIRTQEAGR